jgi:octaprenyl-diphosphate synthase
MAFQIADDILDLVGHEKQTGKSLGTDLDQKKLTLPLIWLLQNGPDVEKHKIKSLLENGSSAQRDQVKSILIDSGAIDYAKNKAEQFIAAGKRDLQALAPSAFRNILHDITDQILNRSC